MTNSEVIDKARIMFPRGITNHGEEKRLINLLNFYNVPFTKESLHKILSIDTNETVKDQPAINQEA